jgi:D-xylose transport system permease protein
VSGPASGQTRRLAVMATVLVAIGVGFHALTGSFLTAENLSNVVQQTAVFGIVASGMALVIVARQIDLAVGARRHEPAWQRGRHGVTCYRRR